MDTVKKKQSEVSLLINFSIVDSHKLLKRFNCRHRIVHTLSNYSNRMSSTISPHRDAPMIGIRDLTLYHLHDGTLIEPLFRPKSICDGRGTI